jgi:X-Pro dipeptidyl-peptidase
MSSLARKLAVGAFACAALGLGGTAATARAADGPQITIGADGETAPVFDYATAIRERVFIPVPGLDSDGNGVIDRVSIDIVRPKESGPSLKVPAIIDDSPYYTSLGRGNETQYIHTTAAGVLDDFPLFYDNYFVPRGYAYIAADAVGTAWSTGCPMHGGPGDVAGFKAVVDWLEGRIPGYSSVDGTTPVVADWANGKNAMIGKSYDGTFANGVAATGVDGLTTIVPLSAISDWYDYSRMGGIRENSHYPTSLDNSITTFPSGAAKTSLGVLPPDANVRCKAIFTPILNAADGDDTGDINAFWTDRDYNKDVGNVKAAVFESHGINDDNVRPIQMAKWWAGLTANNVPRKLWLSLEGHVDPFDYRRGAWVDTLHRWFDYWLQGVPNGIMNEPRVDIETSANTWTTYPDWPLPATVNQNIYLQGNTATTAGALGMQSGGATDSLQWTDSSNQNESTMINTPTGSQTSRRVFLSPVLTHDLHLSGTPTIDITASLSKPQTNLGALIVDYGSAVHTGRGGSDGVSNTSPAVKTCWGDSTPTDSSCYTEVTKPTQTVTSWRVSKGILDSSNRDSLTSSAVATVDQKYEFKFPVLPTDYTVPAGHQIGIVLVANYSGFSSINGTTGTVITLDTKASKVMLPVTGGYAAAVASGAFAPETVAPVLGAMPADISTTSPGPDGTTVTFTPPTATDNLDPSPVVTCTPASGSQFAVGTTTVSCVATDASGNVSAPGTFKVKVTEVVPVNGTIGGSVNSTLSLTLGSAASFGAFAAGITNDYTASMTANVISTAGDGLLSVADPSATATGHLVNGAFSLPSAVQAKAASAAGVGGGFANVGGSAAPTPLLTYALPTANDGVTVSFLQHIGSTDALRTGSYSKTLTFTLSTTTP